MTLTADDVLKQKFTITKFRDGYDLDQVDDFLDSIVDQFQAYEEEIKRLTSENEELKKSLEESNEQLSNAQQQSAQETSEAAENEPLSTDQVENASVHQNDAIKSSAMLQMALELHDKYIRDGEEKKNELISTAEKTAEKILSDAAQKQAAELLVFNNKRDSLEDKVEELRAFESEYRTTLRSYIEAQLRNLDGNIKKSISTDSI